MNCVSLGKYAPQIFYPKYSILETHQKTKIYILFHEFFHYCFILDNRRRIDINISFHFFYLYLFPLKSRHLKHYKILIKELFSHQMF